jgi:CheY-like chemotaxis protein
VKEAANGTDALAAWDSWQPHLILMDMRMPVMNGYEATKVIKQRESVKHREVFHQEHPSQNRRQFQYPKASPLNYKLPNCTVIIALTASAFEEEREKILTVGCDDFIRKPFTQEILLKKVSEHLGVKYIKQLVSMKKEPASEELQTIENKTDFLRHLSHMSPDWVERLHYAAASCSDEMIFELLKEIPKDRDNIFRFLRDLANNYQFEKIMELTKTKAE